MATFDTTKKELQIEYIPIEQLKPYAGNAKVHTEEQIEEIMHSIDEFGMIDPIGIWSNNEIIEGHGRLMACKRLGIKNVPVIRLDALTDEQRRAYALAHNKLTMNTDFDWEQLEAELSALDDIDMTLFGFDEISTDPDPVFEHTGGGTLAEDFIIPPFDIFDARQGRWLERKHIWNERIGDLGQAREDAEANNNDGFNRSDGYNVTMIGTSILDPVLSEVVLKWYTPQHGCNVFDCFAGDTVFGYVSGYLGYHFTGIELRQEQVDFNAERTSVFPCRYICDDGRNVRKYLDDDSQDLMFSCPPYYDLEVYSDLPEDASNQETYEEFYEIIEKAFTDSIRCLKNNRFAVIVCGDVRNRTNGAYYGFPNDIIETFERNGMILYNNIKLLTPIGTA